MLPLFTSTKLLMDQSNNNSPDFNNSHLPMSLTHSIESIDETSKIVRSLHSPSPSSSCLSNERLVSAIDTTMTTTATTITPSDFGEINVDNRYNLKPSVSVEFSTDSIVDDSASIVYSTSFSSKLGEKLSAVAGKISSRLSRNSANNMPSSQKAYLDQLAEKTSLIPTFIEDGTSLHQDLSLNIKLIDNDVKEDRQCRICLMQHNSETEKKDRRKGRKLIAPCRCSGTVQYVHISCLTHWIEVSSRKMYSVPKCELCGYKFRRKPFIDLTSVHFPYVDWCDRILNCLFLFLVAIMILCAWVAISYLQITERRPLVKPSRTTTSKRFLTDNDVTVIIALILFFAAFFIALFTQYRAEVTVFRILSRMWATNRNWRIRNYNPHLDGIADGDDLGINAKSSTSRLSAGVVFVESDSILPTTIVTATTIPPPTTTSITTTNTTSPTTTTIIFNTINGVNSDTRLEASCVL